MHWIGAHPDPSAKRETHAPAKNHWRARLSQQPSAVTRTKEPVQQYDSEPRWPAVIAILAVGGLYTALPDSLTFGPNWLFPSLVLALLVPSVVSYHAGKHRLNAIFGFAVDGVLTVGLIVSVTLLLDALPAGKRHHSSSCSRQHRFGSRTFWFLLYGIGDWTPGDRINGISVQDIRREPSSFRR
jgi:hypothetical protein